MYFDSGLERRKDFLKAKVTSLFECCCWITGIISVDMVHDDPPMNNSIITI